MRQKGLPPKVCAPKIVDSILESCARAPSATTGDTSNGADAFTCCSSSPCLNRKAQRKAAVDGLARRYLPLRLAPSLGATPAPACESINAFVRDVIRRRKRNLDLAK